MFTGIRIYKTVGWRKPDCVNSCRRKTAFVAWIRQISRTFHILDASVGLTVTIKDENDNTPEFGKQKYTFKIKENENDGTDVGDVGATDKDTGSNADIDYTITSGHIFGGVTRFVLTSFCSIVC